MAIYAGLRWAATASATIPPAIQEQALASRPLLPERAFAGRACGSFSAIRNTRSVARHFAMRPKSLTCPDQANESGS